MYPPERKERTVNTTLTTPNASLAYSLAFRYNMSPSCSSQEDKIRTSTAVLPSSITIFACPMTRSRSSIFFVIPSNTNVASEERALATSIACGMSSISQMGSSLRGYYAPSFVRPMSESQLPRNLEQKSKMRQRWNVDHLLPSKSTM